MLLPRPMLDRLIRQDTEWRDDILLEILVLIVAPDHDEVRGEVIQQPSRLAKPRHQSLAMSEGSAGPFVCTVFLSHRLRPPVGPPVWLGEARILEDTFQ